MTFQLAVLGHLDRSFAAWDDLVRALPDEALRYSLSVPSNTIGEQAWCVVGARESYTRAIAAGAWQGFACSLGANDLAKGSDVLEGMRRSARAFRDATEGIEWTDARVQLLLDLLEHENQHQGQLIRYCYAHRIDFPDSWKQRWALA